MFGSGIFFSFEFSSAFTHKRDWDSWKPVLEPIPLASSTSFTLNSLNPLDQICALALPPSNVVETSMSLTVLDDSDSRRPDSPSIISQPLPSPSTAHISSTIVEVIDTKFDLLLPENRIPPYPKEKDYDRYPMTERERARTVKAVVASSVDDFSTKVCTI